MSSDHGKRYAIGSGRTETMLYVLGVIFELEFARGLPPCCLRPEGEKMNLVWLSCIDFELWVCHRRWSEIEVEIVQLGHHPGLYGLGFRYRVCRWFRE